ncbi:TetR/AcrR family transcriptional regulator [Microlunatus speluncae]|uniref:TetR/AcrR family transcriptional regulator n=1 Tax=Microlunatus speluncae TaxID=2594267 RepID=UPI0012666AE7|nr:TetR/AcrR family transcriptional regulator [Microlunatus speluncae]
MSLRDRKRARTRQALVDAATELFERNGYQETTVADIAEAAEIGARTFFSYFASKEELLFPEADARVQATVDAIAMRGPDDGPVDVLLAALGAATAASDEIVSPLARLRLRLIHTVPAVRGRALQVQLAAAREIAERLAEAFPDRLTRVSAGALTGAFIGGVTGALEVLLEEAGEPGDPAVLEAALRTATEVALAPWRTGVP